MLFSSMIFLWIFLPIVFIGNYFLAKKYRNMWLLFSSLFFYSWGEPVYILLMLFVILLNYGIGQLMTYFAQHKKAILAIGILCNLSILGYFKYINFFWYNISLILPKWAEEVRSVALPLGISFYTFQAMSYIIDLYRGQYPVQKNFFSLALYISFFPQLIAGPIVKYKDINMQLAHRMASISKIGRGVRRFIYGLSKKVLLANTFAVCADRIMELSINDLSWQLAWGGAIMYTLQIYYDFSGYSDMAIGLGRMFGFDFLENFQYPYIAKSIREFWQRWHISLSTWFKEYVYIPLGGNRKGKVRTYVNLGVIFLLTGIWHGASWNFVVWGLYHGFFSIVERFCKQRCSFKIPGMLSHVYAMLVVVFGWVIFRIESLSGIIIYMKHMLLPWNYTQSGFAIWEIIDGKACVMLAVGILFCGIFQNITIVRDKFMGIWKYSILECGVCMILLLCCIFSLASATYNPFIYFRF